MKKTKLSLIIILIAAKLIVRVYPDLQKQVTELNENGLDDLKEVAEAVILHNQEIAKQNNSNIDFLDKLTTGALSFFNRELSRRSSRQRTIL